MASMRKTYASLLFASLSFLQGMASTLDMGGNLIEYNLSTTPDEADCSALLHDWLVVGNDLRVAIGSYGK